MKAIYSCTGVMLAILVGVTLFRPHVVKGGPGSLMTANSAATPPAIPAQKLRLTENYGRLPLRFEANQGQTDSHVKFLSRGRGYSLFLTGDEAVLTLGSASQNANRKSQNPGVKAGLLPALRACPEPCERSANGIVAQHPLFGAAALPDLLSLSVPKEKPDNHVEEPRDRKEGPALPSSYRLADSGDSSTVLRMRLVGANASAAVTGADELPGKSNYFIGNDPKKWRTNVANYAKVKYQSVYPGVDLVYYGNQSGQLECDFVVAPGADPDAIRLALSGDLEVGSRQTAVGGTDATRSALDVGAVREPPTVAAVSDRRSAVGTPPLQERAHRDAPLQIAPDGDLVVKTDGGEVRFHKPIVYQPGLPSTAYSVGSSPVIRHSSLVEGHYVLQANHQVGFKVASYDHTRPLVIDPVLSYSTYLGGSGNEIAYAIAVDSSGSAYVTGFTYSSDFPTTAGAFRTSSVGGGVFVTKLDPTGTTLVYSTYLGGSGQSDIGYGIAVDASGNAYVTGLTGSSDFPTLNPVQPTNHGSANAFVAKLSPAGSALIYSTFLGGSSNDWANGIAVDPSGNAYVTGSASSADFPTVNPLQAVKRDPQTAFVAKLNSAGSALVYSTYLGGSGDFDVGIAIAVDPSGDTYIAGATDSADFPTVNPVQATLGSLNAWHGFVSKMNEAGSALIYSTYLGGSSSDGATGIAVDASGNAYVAGWTQSTDFPTVNPFQASNHGDYDAFVTKFDAAGSALVYSTYLGGSKEDGSIGFKTGIAVDAFGNAYVAGMTGSTDFPTANPVQASLVGSRTENAFVAKLNGDGSSLVFSTYLGGGPVDVAMGIAVGPSGNAYVTGETASTNFPTVNPFQASTHSAMSFPYGYTAFVAKIGAADSPGIAFGPGVLTFPEEDVGTPINETLTLTAAGSDPLTLSDLALEGTNSTDFTQTNTCGTLPATLPGGSQCIFTVTFTPEATGTRTANLTFTDNAANSPQTIPLTGGVQLPLALSTTILNFAPQLELTTTPPQPVTITNNTGQTVVITNIIVTNNYLGLLPDFGFSGFCGAMAPGASCVLQVTFTPRSIGIKNDTLSIYGGPNSPQTVALNGTGVLPGVNLYPSLLSFGNQIVGTTSAAQTVTLTNTGNTTLSITSIVPSGDFAITNNTCGATVLANANCTFGVTFTPTVLGSRSGAVTVTDNGPGSPQTVSLTGTGTLPALVITASSASMTYGGAVPTITASYAGFVNGDSSASLTTLPTCSTTATSSSPVGSYPSTCSGAVDAKYTISYAAGTVTITPVALIITAPSPTITAGSAIPSLTPTYTGFVNGQTAGSLTTQPVCTTTASNSSPAGTYPITCSGAVDANYNISYVAGTLTITGTGLQGTMSLSPTSLSFGNQVLNTTSGVRSVTVSNTGTGPLNVSSVAASTEYAANSTCTSPVNPGGACTVNVTFTPNALGTQTGTVTLTSNASNGPQVINLSGNGFSGAALSCTNCVVGGFVVGSGGGEKIITLANAQNVALTNISVSIAGSNDYSQTNTCGTTLGARQTCTITVTFTPSIVGVENATLTVADSAANNPQTATLMGAGLASAAPSQAARSDSD